MAPTIPEGVPASLVAGTTWKWTYKPSAFPTSEGWTLQFRIAGAGLIEATADVVGDYYSITVNATSSAEFAPGLYQWRSIASKSGEVYSVESGTVDVVANPDSDGFTDARSFAAKQLEKVEAELGARFGTATTPLGSAHESYTIGGRNITKISIEDLQVMRSRLIAEVERERNGGVLPPFEIGFERPSSTRRRGPFRGNY